MAVLLFLVFLGGCATLPNVEKVVQETPTTAESPPTIVTARKQLSARESWAVIGRLKRQTLPTDILQRHLTVEEAISGNPLVAGNKVTLLVDGPATYAAMTKAIQDARDHVNFETFIFAADEAGRSFGNLLLQKEAEGVQVNLIYDSLGSLTTPRAFFRHLDHGNFKILEFNPVSPLRAPVKWLTALTHRDHRKILITDGSVVITGGVNITQSYSLSSFGSHEEESEKFAWRDTDVQIEGPAAAEFQRLFMDTWEREKGPELPKRNYFRPPQKAGTELVRVIGSTPGGKNRATYMTYISAITFASESIHLTNSYFVPDQQTLNALTDAAQRGVDVKIILPAKSDSRLAYYAGRAHYSRLLKSGVKLYERRNAVLHAKTAIIDGVWSSVGSTNMDRWSFLRNDEVNAVILGRDFAGQMEAMFRVDLDNSNAIDLKKWEQRSFAERMKEMFSRSLGYWL